MRTVQAIVTLPKGIQITVPITIVREDWTETEKRETVFDYLKRNLLNEEQVKLLNEDTPVKFLEPELTLKQVEETSYELEERLGWLDQDPYYAMNLFVEEVGEMAKEIRKIETGRLRPDEPVKVTSKEDLILEMGDVLFSLTKFSNYYKIPLKDAFLAKMAEMQERYKDVLMTNRGKND